MLARLPRPRRPAIRPLVRWFSRLAFTAAVTMFVLLAAPPYGWAVATVPEVITNLRNWIIGILSGLATLFLTFGGLRYLMASSDPGEVEAAKRALKAAAIGYGLAILAPVIVTVLQEIVGAEGGGGQ
ncbi:pilin [Streptomyces phaeochromogenes]|uniref:pilin n=1 Tax=Streptomyces phaeochromogenes TaxID=1923 RepID=UPI0036C850F8